MKPDGTSGYLQGDDGGNLLTNPGSPVTGTPITTGTANNGAAWTTITPPAGCVKFEIRARLGTMQISSVTPAPGENYASIPAGQPVEWSSSAPAYIKLGSSGTIETIAYV